MPKTDTRRKPPVNAEPEASIKTAKLFANGRSQAVRLPKEFRFEGTEVAIRRNRETGEVVLAPLEGPQEKTWDQWFELFDSLSIPEDTFRREVHMPTERDVFE